MKPLSSAVYRLAAGIAILLSLLIAIAVFVSPVLAGIIVFVALLFLGVGLVIVSAIDISIYGWRKR